jgi:hypothetical protein
VDERSRAAVVATEDFLSGRIGQEDLIAGLRGAEGVSGPFLRQVRETREPLPRFTAKAYAAAASAAAGLARPPIAAAAIAADYSASAVKFYAQVSRRSARPDARAERQAQQHLLRDVVGDPFRVTPFPAVWRPPTARALAEGIDAERAFDRLPILADALEEGGCDSPDVLLHLRRPGLHARGCWVVDLVLGKE